MTTDQYGNEIDADDGNPLSKLRKGFKEYQRENKELKERLERLESQSQARDLGRVFVSKGLDPRMVKFYAGDGSDESIDKWIEDNDELLGLRKPAGDESEPSTVQASDQEAFELMRNIASDRKLVLDLNSRLEAAEDQASVMAIIAEARGLGLPDM
jgi:hypothetical protein